MSTPQSHVNAVLISGKTLFIAVSDRILAYTIDDPVSPRSLCETKTRGAPYLLAYANGALFAMEVFHEGEELAVFTHADGKLTECVRIHVADFVSGFPRDMASSGNEITVADIYRGICIVDASAADHPTFRPCTQMPGLQSICLTPPMLVAGSDRGDITSFTRDGNDWKPGISLTVVEGCIEALAAGSGIIGAAFGRYGSHGYTGFSGIAFIECDGASMRERSRVELDRNAMGIYIRENIAAVLLQEWGHEWYETASGVRIYDIADTDTPKEIGRFERNAKFEHWAVQWPYAYVADRMFGIRIIDLSDPRSPREIAAVPIPGLSS